MAIEEHSAQNRVFWLQREHFSFEENAAWLEQTAFSLKGFYDVVAAPHWRITSEIQPWNEIWLVEHGRVEIVLDGHSTIVSAGEIAVLLMGQKRDSREIDGQPLSILGFSFTASLLDTFEVPALLQLPARLNCETAVYERLKSFMQNGMSESRRGQPGFSLSAHSWAQIVFVEVLRQAFPGAELNRQLHQRLRNSLAPEITETLDFIAASFSQPIELKTLANRVHLSVPYFARKFKQVTGTAPMEYLRHFRLEKARQLLLSNDKAIGEIAESCGFTDAAYFSRAFKEFTGASPADFRRQTRAFHPRKS